MPGEGHAVSHGRVVAHAEVRAGAEGGGGGCAVGFAGGGGADGLGALGVEDRVRVRGRWRCGGDGFDEVGEGDGGG